MVQYVLSGTAGTQQKENREQAVKLHHSVYRKIFCWDFCTQNLIPGGETKCFVVHNLSLFLFAGTEFVPRELPRSVINVSRPALNPLREF